MCGVDLCPGLDDREDLGGGQVRKSEIVGWGEGKDVAFSCHGLSAQ